MLSGGYFPSTATAAAVSRVRSGFVTLAWGVAVSERDDAYESNESNYRWPFG